MIGKPKWTGTVTWIKTSKGKAKTVSNNNGHEDVHRYDNYFAYHTDANFVNSTGIVTRSDTSRKWEKDSLFYSNPDIYTIDETTEKIYRNKKGSFNLDVEFSDDKKTYWISFFGPICPEFFSFERNSTILGHSIHQQEKMEAYK